MNPSFALVSEFGKMLRNLDTWLDKAVAYAKTRPFEADVLVSARLYPDMYSLDRQVQSACDAAKFAAAYLANKEAPKHPDTEKTIAELRARIAKCLGFLESVKESDFAGADERKVAPPWLQGAWLRGEDYLIGASMPNFMFHVTMVYAILRHSGVPVGKMDFIGALPVKN